MRKARSKRLMPRYIVQMPNVEAAPSRVQSVDLLRGLVMAIMAIDHVRDFFHGASFHFSPEDLRNTYGILFFTRWITHFCAPVFVFLAGVSIYLSNARSRHLVTRGLWLVLLELTVFEVMWTFDLRYEIVVLQVIWVIGWSMVLLAGAIWLPRRVLAVLAVGTIVLHNTLDGVSPAQFGSYGWLWNVLHAPTMIRGSHTSLFVLYPLMPWFAVMAAGYCLGPVFQMPEERRRRLLVRLGWVLIAAFFVVRMANVYGDPQPWAAQRTIELTIISFFRASKYPPSLVYLLMTLGPALLFLGLMDRVRVSANNPLRVFGRVPMFYYVLHFYLIHALAVLFSGLRYGRWDHFVHFPGFLLGMPAPGFPADWGYSLGAMYGIWLGVLVILYFPCRWYMGVKQRSRSVWLSYL
jgi:uncharacterized membrane protein